MSRPEITIGFVRLSDAAPLAAAVKHRTFDKYELNIALKRFSSWASMRDALGTGAITAAHMLAPMVVASAAHLGPFPGQFTTGFIFNLNGNAITVSTALFDEIQSHAPGHMQTLPMTASGVKTISGARREKGLPPLVFAHVFPHSMHAYELRYWLGAAGIDPEKDVQLVVIPPSQMVNALTRGEIDGYCVGEPWNCVAVTSGVGKTLITSSEIWSNSPEKALAVRTEWAKQNHDTHIVLISALIEAAAWVDQPDNRLQAAKLVASPDMIDVPLEDVLGSLTGSNRQTGGRLRIDIPDFNVFHRYAANFPWHSHAKWILSQMIRWGDAPMNMDVDKVSVAAFRPDIYREAAHGLGIACPNTNEKREGSHSHAWLMTDATKPIAFGPDRFIDGRIFDPNEVLEYVKGFQIRYAGSTRLGDSDRLQAVTRA
ncbi:MAG: CmpA/NrtA family ABC transporter substrate-binding protein [Pseudomonadota bacterium]